MTNIAQQTTNRQRIQDDAAELLRISHRLDEALGKLGGASADELIDEYCNGEATVNDWYALVRRLSEGKF